MTLLDALSWMEAGDKSLRKQLEHAYNVSADIGLIAKQFKSKGIEGIKHLKATPGIPIRPQQAERLGTAEEMIIKVEIAAVEWKLDGFRAQVHVRQQTADSRQQNKKQLQLNQNDSDKEVQIFSRSLENTTHMFPEIVDEFEKLDVDSVILDGEAIGYDPKTGKHLPFQETIQRKRKHDISEMQKKIPLRYYAFDILSLNGESYLTKPFNERRKSLEKLLQEKSKDMLSDTVTIADQLITSDPQELDKQFDESVKKGFEGIMVKKNDAVYQAGARNYNWIKFKHHGEGKLSDTLDCLVLGYYAGKGKRSGFGIGAFLVGVRNSSKFKIQNSKFQSKSKKENNEVMKQLSNEQFVTVAKIGTGLSDEQWKELKIKCQKSNVKSKPQEYDVPKELFPDVWVMPEIVVEIAADEITKSPLHTAGLALRFPRLVNFRDDKSPSDVTTTKEVEKLFKMQ
jgi:DNA ligase 1